MKRPAGAKLPGIRPGLPATVARRPVLRALGVAAGAPFLPLLGCGHGSATGVGGGGADGGPAADAAMPGSGSAWASGGTAAMTMAASYPDPFAGGPGTSCNLLCSTTVGPCYAATPARRDISEGAPGLPMRIALLVVDGACQPVPGATVDIWHTSPAGVYSGNDAAPSCTLGDAAARAARWFRGVQSADTRGRVDFDSCYPGWYRGRTVHIHLTVRVRGSESVTSQLLFDDALSDDILRTQALYSARGPRDTHNGNDGVVAASAAADYTFQTERMADGALLAWKTLVIRSSTATPLCTVPGG